MISNSHEKSEHGIAFFWADPDGGNSRVTEMNWQIGLHSDPAHVRINLSGSMNVAGLRDVWAEVFRKKYWRKDTPIVFDLTEVDVTGLGLKDIEKLVAMLNELPGDLPGGRLLMIAGSDVAFGKTRQYQTLSDLRKSITIDVFRREQEALESLNS
jgi:hypothetical protein